MLNSESTSTQDFITANVYDPDAPNQMSTARFDLQPDANTEPDPTDQNVASKGKLVTRKVAISLIDLELQPKVACLKAIDVKRKNNISLTSTEIDEEEAILDSVVDVVFGRELLMLLLSQSGCEAIRFYFAKKPSGSDTLVAYGVDAGGKDIGSPVDEGSILAWKKVPSFIGNEPMGGETVPPNTLREIKKFLDIESLKGSYNKSVAEYIGK